MRRGDSVPEMLTPSSDTLATVPPSATAGCGALCRGCPLKITCNFHQCALMRGQLKLDTNADSIITFKHTKPSMFHGHFMWSVKTIHLS